MRRRMWVVSKSHSDVADLQLSCIEIGWVSISARYDSDTTYTRVSLCLCLNSPVNCPPSRRYQAEDRNELAPKRLLYIGYQTKKKLK